MSEHRYISHRSTSLSGCAGCACDYGTHGARVNECRTNTTVVVVVIIYVISGPASGAHRRFGVGFADELGRMSSLRNNYQRPPFRNLKATMGFWQERFQSPHPTQPPASTN